MKIFRESDIPIHRQLEDTLLEEIKKGRLRPGDRAYSEYGLAQKYGISRSTVRNVFDRLVSKNILVRRAGKGTFVSFPVTAGNASLLVGFSNKMSKLGISPQTRLLKKEVKIAEDPIQEKLRLNPGEKIIEIERLRYINRIPFVIHLAILPYGRCKSILGADLEKVGLTSYLREFLGIALTYADETIFAYPCGPEEAKWLEVKKGFPVLAVEGVSYDPNESPVRYTFARYRSDIARLRTKFHQEKQGQAGPRWKPPVTLSGGLSRNRKEKA